MPPLTTYEATSRSRSGKSSSSGAPPAQSSRPRSSSAAQNSSSSNNNRDSDSGAAVEALSKQVSFALQQSSVRLQQQRSASALPYRAGGGGIPASARLQLASQQGAVMPSGTASRSNRGGRPTSTRASAKSAITMSQNHVRPRPMSTGRLRQSDGSDKADSHNYAVLDDMSGLSQFSFEEKKESDDMKRHGKNNSSNAATYSLSHQQNPEDVARAILDMRSQRKQHHQQSNHGGSNSNSRGRSGRHASSTGRAHSRGRAPSSSGGSSNNNNNPNSKKNNSQATSKARVSRSTPRPPQATTPRSPQEQQAAASLDKAEKRIEGLLQELEDLKFLQELDDTAAAKSPVAKKTPRGGNVATLSGTTGKPSSPAVPWPSTSPALQASPTMAQPHMPQKATPPQAAYNTSYQHYSSPQNHHVQQQSAVNSPSYPTHGAVQQHRSPPVAAQAASPPPPVTVIRAPAASTQRTLPPPPAMAPPKLSPRTISRLDRHSLELETQTLCRDVQVLGQEKATLQAAVQHYEQCAAADQARASAQIQLLETQLRQLSGQFQGAQRELQGTREAVRREWQDHLEEERQEHQRALDVVTVDRDKYRKKAEQIKATLMQRTAQWTENWEKERANLEESQNVLEQAFTDITQENEQLSTELQDKDAALEALQKGFDEFRVRTAKEKEETVQVALTEKDNLQSQLDEAQKATEDVENSKLVLQGKLDEALQRLALKEEELDAQTTQLTEANERLDSVHTEYREKFVELKDLYETKEKRRLSEMVEANASKSQAYEERLKNLQQQLQLATDRHETEMQQQKVQFDEQLMSHEEKWREQVESEYASRSNAVQNELKIVKEQLNAAEDELRQVRRQAESSTRDAMKELKELEIQDTVRQDELRLLKEKTDKLNRQLDEKGSEVADLERRMDEAEARHAARVRMMENRHAADKAEHEEEVANLQKDSARAEKQSQARAMELTNRLEEESMEHSIRVKSLEQELEQTRAELSQTRPVLQREVELKEQLNDMNAACKRLQNELDATRSRHEQVTSDLRSDMERLQDKLSSSEAALRTKREEIQEMEQELRSLQLHATSSAEEKQRTTEELQRDLKVVRHQLERERAIASAKNEEQDELQKDVDSLRHRVDRMSELEGTVAKLNSTVADLEDEKMSSMVELSRVQKEYDVAKQRLCDCEAQLEEYANQAAEIEMKYRETDGSVAESLAEVKDKLRAEKKAKEELIDRLGDMEADLEIKEHQLSRLPKLQQQLREMIKGREELQATLGGKEAELERKEKQIAREASRHAMAIGEVKAQLEERNRGLESLRSQLSQVEKDAESRKARWQREQSDFQSRLKEQEEEVDDLRSKLQRADSENARRKREMVDVSNDFSMELQMKVESLTKAKASLEAKLREQYEEQEEREKQIKETSDRYSNQITELRVRVEELTKSRDSLRQKLASAEEEMDRKEEMISLSSSQLSVDVADLQTRLGEHLAEKSALQARVDELEDELRSNKLDASKSQSLEMKQLQEKIDVESREKRSLRAKINDAEEELVRKEKQIKDIVDRYSGEISDLETKLSIQLRAKTSLQKEVDSLKNTDQDVADAASSEASAMRERVESLERSIELEKALNKDSDRTKKRLEDELAQAKKEQTETNEKLEKALGERAEVIGALEEIINEVQSREDEIESLAKLLHKRDEELDHAKLIATKALQSAQEIKARYRGKEGDKVKEHLTRIGELESTVEYLAGKNEGLQQKMSKLERELHDKQTECKALKSKLTEQGGQHDTAFAVFNADSEDSDIDLNGFRSSTKKENVNEQSFGVSSSRRRKEPNDTRFQSPSKGMDPPEAADGDFGSSPSKRSSGRHHHNRVLSPTTASTKSSQTGGVSDMGIPHGDTMSMTSSDIGNASVWLADFGDSSTIDSNDNPATGAASFTGILSEPGGTTGPSRRAIERDALRKYVRKRYLKSKTPTSPANNA